VTIDIDALDDGDGLVVRDAAEGEQFTLRTDRTVDPTPASTDEFAMPVDAVVAIEAGELHFPVFAAAIFMRDGEVVHHTDDPAATERLPRDTYEIEVTVPAAKTFVKVTDATVAARYDDADEVSIDAGRPTRVLVGIRSHHERPAATVRTTSDPEDLARAVSTFGSSLKTLTPDRSWPSLRGHPPALELGESLAVPEAAEPPESGVTVEVPPDYGPIFTVAPLAYYLGATVERSTTPRLRAAGATREFDADALAADVRDCLEHVFTLDSVVRSVGRYPFRTEQADRLDDRVTLDYERLFELSLDERTAAYLEVPRSATRGLIDWHLTADVVADPRYAPALPHVVAELAAVRSPPPTPDNGPERSTPDAAVRTSIAEQSTALRTLDPVETPGHVWLGDGFVANAINSTLGSLRRALEWPRDDGPLDVHVVYNDDSIDAPDEVPYDTHATEETNLQVSRSLSTAELRNALLAETDFLHFIGHVTERGMECSDGTLDVRTLPTTGVGAFFLNGCRSYEQGFALLTAGATGGIVTTDDIEDTVASTAGRHAAVLLGNGFPLYAVLDVFSHAGVGTERYTVLGDPTLQLRKPLTGSPVLYEFATDETADASDAVPLTSHSYPGKETGLASLLMSVHTADSHNLLSASATSTAMSFENLAEYLESVTMPTLLDDDLHLTDDLSVEDFR
jgi:hypothetical protein